MNSGKKLLGSLAFLPLILLLSSLVAFADATVLAPMILPVLLPTFWGKDHRLTAITRPACRDIKV